jgi:hypothetical protein
MRTLISVKEDLMSKLRNTQVILGAAAPLTLLAACSSDVVDLGNDGVTQSLQRGTLCADSPIAQGPIEIMSQDDLDALRGCEEVRGDLNIRIFADTDLSPLSSLRAVAGRFTFGQSPETYTEETAETWSEGEAERDRVAEAGWLDSLHGLEALERVGSLEMDRIAAPDLLPLSNLRNLAGNDDPLYAGRLHISRARALVNLAGLENAGGVADLSIGSNPALESLSVLRLSRDVPGFVSLYDNPRLTDIFALAPLEAARSLSIERCGVTDLDALAGFSLADGIDIRENRDLIDISGLANASFGELRLEANPRIVNVPEFINNNNNSRVNIVGNAELASVVLGFTVGFGSLDVEGQEIFIGESWIRITDNPKLALIEVHSMPEASYLGITSAQVFTAHRNAALQRIDLGSLRSLNLLSIGDNPELTEVALGDLERADEIAVTGNPQLVTAELRELPTFESRFSGNADDPVVELETTD